MTAEVATSRRDMSRRVLLQRVASVIISSAVGLSPLAASCSHAESVTVEPGSETVTSSDVIVGTGQTPRPGQLIKVHYTLTLDGFEGSGGQVVDSSRSRGRPFRYNFMSGQTIAGWDQGVEGMHVGGRRHIVVPAALGYGSRAVGPIPANSTLYFDIELLGVNS